MGTNNKCPCGSNKKYKKCCKKLEKYGYHPMEQKDKNEYDHPEMEILNQMNFGIDRAEHQIAHFKGKKADKIKLIKELDKAKSKRDALENKVDRERNKAIKWKNKQNQITINTSNGYKQHHRQHNAVNKAMVAKT